MSRVRRKNGRPPKTKKNSADSSAVTVQGAQIDHNSSTGYDSETDYESETDYDSETEWDFDTDYDAEADEQLSPAERYAAFKSRQRDSHTQLAVFRQQLPFTLDPFQDKACRELESGTSVLVAAPTAAGKTVIGEFGVHLALNQGKRVFYTTPIKALSNQKYGALVDMYGADQVGLLTGDTSVNGGAPIVVMTTEVLRNMLYSQSKSIDDLGYVILDEVHYLADRFRGPVWEEVIIHLPEDILLICLSATVSNAEEFGDWLTQVRGSCAVIVSEVRPVPLWQHMFASKKLYDLYIPSKKKRPHSKGGKLNPELLETVKRIESDQFSRSHHKHGRHHKSGSPAPSRHLVVRALAEQNLLPAIVFVFSRDGCDAAVEQILNAGISLTTSDERRQIHDIIEDAISLVPASDYAVLRLNHWQDALGQGVAAHHAGLLPVMKECIERLFARGLVKVVYATETLALGINMPARTVVIESLRKWNGSGHVNLTPGEYTQLTGRAGRRLIDSEGHAVVVYRRGVEPHVVSALASKRTYPLYSAFRPTYNMVVNLLQRATRAQAREILEQSFAQYQADKGVVSLAHAARDAQRSTEKTDKKMQCERGDFSEYMLLRKQLSEAEKLVQTNRKSQRKTDTKDAMSQLKQGDVISYRTERRQRHGVVMDLSQSANGSMVLSLVSDNAQLRRLSPEQITDGLSVLGHISLRTNISGRSARQRAEIVKTLQTGLHKGTFSKKSGPKPNKKPTAAALDVVEIQNQLVAHPCHTCPDRETHAHYGRDWLKAQKQYGRLLERIDSRTSSVAKQFDTVCAVLEELGALTDKGVSKSGLVLAKIYSERDLLVAQCLRNKVWHGLSSAELAAAVSPCIYEDRGDAPFSPVIPPGKDGMLANAVNVSEVEFRKLRSLEKKFGAPDTPDPSMGLVAAVFAWASGASLSTTLAESGMSAGDFVRWCKQLIDLLRQIAKVGDPKISPVAHSAVALIHRGVVAWSEV